MESVMRQAAITDRSPHGLTYKRHRPEQTLLYRIIERHYPAFKAVMSAQGNPLPAHVQQEFDEYLKCSWLEHGFLRVQCTECHHEHLVAFSCKRCGFCPSVSIRSIKKINNKINKRSIIKINKDTHSRSIEFSHRRASSSITCLSSRVALQTD